MKRKLIAGFVFVLFMFSLFSLQIFAMTSSEYVSYLKSKSFANEYIIFAENHFKTYKYTATQIDSLKSYTDQILAIVNPKNPEVVTTGASAFVKSKFTAAEEEQLVDLVTKAGAALDLTVVITRGPDSIRYAEFYSKTGKKLGTISPKYNTLKYTDGTLDTNLILILSLLALIAMLVGGYFVSKKVFAKKELVA